MDRLTKNLVEGFSAVISTMIMKTLFLAAGCWLAYNGWFCCAGIVFFGSIMVGFEHDDEQP